MIVEIADTRAALDAFHATLETTDDTGRVARVPCFSSTFCSAVAISASRPAAMRSMYSTTTTSLPRRS